MADERINYTPGPNEEPFGHPPQYHVTVLLVDDQAIVCEAVRRALRSVSASDVEATERVVKAITRELETAN